MKPQVTVGIPTYNNENTVEETIRSLMAQNFRDWVCIIADDSEDDRCIAAIRTLVSTDNRFTVIKNSQRLGAAGNWNKVLNLCETEYFKLLCADDVLAPTAIEDEVSALESNSNAVMSCGRRDIVNSAGKLLFRDRGLRTAKAKISGHDAIKKFVRTGTNYFGEPSFVLFRTKILKLESGFDSDWKYLIDVESYISVLSRGDLVNVDRNLGSFRISSESWSANLSRSQRAETFQAIDFAKTICEKEIHPWDSSLGKIRATINTVFRRMIFRFLA